MIPQRQELCEAIDEALDFAERVEAPSVLIALLEAAADSLIRPRGDAGDDIPDPDCQH